MWRLFVTWILPGMKSVCMYSSSNCKFRSVGSSGQRLLWGRFLALAKYSDWGSTWHGAGINLSIRTNVKNRKNPKLLWEENPIMKSWNAGEIKKSLWVWHHNAKLLMVHSKFHYNYLNFVIIIQAWYSYKQILVIQGFFYEKISSSLLSYHINSNFPFSVFFFLWQHCS